MRLRPTPKAIVGDIAFFDQPSTCQAYFNNDVWVAKAFSIFESYINLLCYSVGRLWLVLRKGDATLEPMTKLPEQAKNKTKLIVCIHGLNNNPTQFIGLVRALKKYDLSQTHILIPRVRDKGNAKLDEMVQPIFKEIQQWAKCGKGRELVLIGVSNGGRIARALESKIAQSGVASSLERFRFVSIVGALNGSSLATFAKRMGLTWFMSKSIADEMPANSLRTQALNREWTRAQEYGPKREYTFFASPHDWQVTNYSSSLMDVPNSRHSKQYALVPGHGHNSIVNAVARHVAKFVTSD